MKKRVDFMALKGGIKIIIQDVVEPEPEKEGGVNKNRKFYCCNGRNRWIIEPFI